MLKNYFKVALRNLWKHKLFSLINVVGLGMAMAFCLLILIQVQSSFEKDRFHPYPGRTYRIIADVTNKDDKTFALATAAIPLAEKLRNEQSGIERVARVIRDFSVTLSNSKKSLPVNGLYVDPDYFKIFGFPLEKGRPAIAPYTVVLTHETAARYFGTDDPVGKTLSQRELGTFTVTGVFAPLKGKKTHLQSDLVVSMSTYPLLHPEVAQDDWLNYNAGTYVLLNEHARPEVLDRALANAAKASRPYADPKAVKEYAFRKQLVKHISPSFEMLYNNPNVEPFFKVLINIIMAIVLVSLAGFNYVNLTLTHSLSRAREVGVRKVAGAKRSQLLIQFLLDTAIISLLALGVGYVGLAGMQTFIRAGWITWEVQHTGLLWLFFVAFALLTGLIAGILPARILSAYKPVQILKGTLSPASFGKIGIRKTLIVIQFVVSLVFMIFTATMYSQFRYMATDNENYNRKNILNIHLAANTNYRLLVNEIAREAGVQRIGMASAALSEAAARIKISSHEQQRAGIGLHDAFKYSTDARFIENMQLRFIAGSNLPPAGRDTGKGRFAVINEKAVQTLGLGDAKAAIGKTILVDSSERIVTGVVKNFSFMRYELPVAPLVLDNEPQAFRMLSLQVQPGVQQQQLANALEGIWKRFYPYEPFEYAWYEQQLYDVYLANEDLKLFGTLVAVVFVIAALGLLGVVTYNTEKRTREVGVRKVMGASVTQLMGLLSWSFLKLILIAAAIALPLGGFLGSLFLNIFTYHASLGIWIFLLCAGSLFLTGVLTIGIRTYRAAMASPAKILRTE
jgi:putative ABC transport system permease protein